MEKQESTYTSPWLERRKQSTKEIIMDPDFIAMLEELCRGPQQ